MRCTCFWAADLLRFPQSKKEISSRAWDQTEVVYWVWNYRGTNKQNTNDVDPLLMELWGTKKNYLTDASSKFWCPARTMMGTPLKIPSIGESLLISLTRKTIVLLELIATICIFFYSLDAAVSETGNLYAHATKISATGRGGLCLLLTTCL